VTVRPLPDVKEEPFQCQNRLGIFEAMATLQVGQPAEIHHPRCLHKGDDACCYLIQWKEKASCRWKRAAAAICAIASVGTIISFNFLSLLSWTLLTLFAAAGCLLVAARAWHLERRELVEAIVTQGDAADRLLEEANNRYRNAQLIQEIGQAGADMLEVEPFLKTVLDSMARNLNFPRGLIALCDDDRQRFQHVESYGFSDKARQWLIQTNVGITCDCISDIFIQALRKGRPVFLDEIHQQTDGLSPDQEMIHEALDVRSLISFPLVRKDKIIGLLVIDTDVAKKDLTTSDVNFLLGISSQIATGIVNARSYSRLLESEQRYRLLAENVTDAIWILDIDSFKMTYVSPSIEKMQGYTPHEIIAMPIDQFLTPDSYHRATVTITKTMELAAMGKIDPKHDSMTLALEAYHKNGSIIPTEVTARILIDEDEKPYAVLGISRDLSNRKRAEKERLEMENKLQRSKKMESLGTMAGSIAHNFNNLLIVVLGILELAKEDVP
jgi:PAS domain S-box-containing protein